jgi:DNA polymerase-3 subunit delta'
LICPGSHKPGYAPNPSLARVVALSEEEPFVPKHPDVVLVGRGVYGPAQIGRSELTGISVEQIRRVVLARVGFRPHEAEALVFIVRGAEDLTASAANALLKTLEEPPSGLHFILLTSRPQALLDTIRSRTLPVRFGPLPEQALVQILRAHGKPEELATRARGSAEVALELADDERVLVTSKFVAAALQALEVPDLSQGLRVAGEFAKDRRELELLLDALAEELRLRALRVASSDPYYADRIARAFQATRQSITALKRNAGPTLACEALIQRMRELLPYRQWAATLAASAPDA